MTDRIFDDIGPPKLVKLSAADIMAWLPIGAHHVCWGSLGTGPTNEPDNLDLCPLAGFFKELDSETPARWDFAKRFRELGYDADAAVFQLVEAADNGEHLRDSTEADRSYYRQMKRVLA